MKQKRQISEYPDARRSRTSRNGAVWFAVVMLAVGFAAVLAITWAVARAISLGSLIAAVLAGLLLASSVHVVMEWERAVIMRLGKFNRVSGPGLVFTIPIVEFYAVIVDQRIVVTYFGAEETLTSDLVPVNVDAVLLWMVFSPKKAAIEVEDYASTVQWVAQTTLRRAIGRSSAAEVARRREDIDGELKAEIEEKLSDWGIDIVDVEIRDIVIPKELQEAMALEAVAERRREARMVLAEAERDIACMFSDAAQAYGDPDAALRLRTMHLAFESAKESGGTVVLPSNFAEGFVDTSSSSS